MYSLCTTLGVLADSSYSHKACLLIAVNHAIGETIEHTSQPRIEINPRVLDCIQDSMILSTDFKLTKSRFELT